MDVILAIVTSKDVEIALVENWKRWEMKQKVDKFASRRCGNDKSSDNYIIIESTQY